MSAQSQQSCSSTLMPRGNERIKNVEKKTFRMAPLESNVHSEFEEATQSGFSKVLFDQEFAQQREAQLGRVALVLVRREALRRVLEEERQLHVKELSQKGLAIYQQRI